MPLPKIKYMIIFASIIAVGLLAMGLVLMLKKNEIYVTPGSVIFYTEQSIPSIYLVDSSFNTPSKAENSSLVSSMLDFFEGSYRQNGIKNNYVSSDRYVKFSPSMLRKSLEFCCNFSSSQICTYDFSNLTLASLLSIMNQTFGLHSLAYPETSPPNIAYLTSSSIVYTISSILWVQTVADIKHSLFESESPLLLSIPRPISRYWLPCSDHRVNKSEECINLSYSCPSSINERNCGFLDFPAELSTSEYFLPRDGSSLVAGEPLSFLLCGWSDDYTSNTGIPSKSVSRHTGGFIVKSFNGPDGNNDNFYAGDLSYLHNLEICPHPNNPFSWDAPSFECINSGQSDCTGAYGPIAFLECVDESKCNKSYRYSLLRASNGDTVPLYYEPPDGISVTKMIMWNGSKHILFDFDSDPFYRLGSIFHSIGSSNQKPNISCGYWFLPYNLVDSFSKMHLSKDKTVFAAGLSVKWAKESYQKYAPSEDQLYLSMSTHPMTQRAVTSYY